MPDKNDVPLMYRAQVEGRCQLHRIHKRIELDKIANEEGLKASEQYSVRWANQWLASQGEVENPGNPLLKGNFIEDTSKFQTKDYTISWRFVTNGGKDDGIIRPLITSSGLPFYPGSSMKGAFRAACKREEKAGRLPQGTCDDFCGAKLTDGDAQPGILQFHGGYPVNEWQKNLVDIVHPQQGWQVKSMDTINKPNNESAFALISLYKPTIKFGISCQIKEIDWNQIWEIWEKALAYGIGCRVSGGYGLVDDFTGDILYQVKLHGTGAVSKLLDKKAEFRPNIFRAALRGHALRIFSGLNISEAENIVDELFGGIRSGKEQVGLLGMAFHQDSINLGYVCETDVYDVTGNLIWSLSGKLENHDRRSCLQELVEKLTKFAILLGGFGKSWRRADHQIFYPKYTKHIIGCHWNWIDNNFDSVKNLDEAKVFIQGTIEVAEQWMKQSGVEIKRSIIAQLPTPNQDITKQQSNKPVPKPKIECREAWYQNNVQVWGRIAKNKQDSKVIEWLHSPQQGGNQQYQKGNYHNKQNNPQKQTIPLALQRGLTPKNTGSRPSIYRTSLTGRLHDSKKSEEPTQIGRLWHRMYPVENGQYLELITIFPQKCTEAEQLIKWLCIQPEWKNIW